MSLGEAVGKRPLCASCGTVIGVYEPLTVVTESGTRQSSLAAEPSLAVADAEMYHHACHLARALD